MSNSNLDRLRLDVRKRRGQVTAKENRIRRTTGVDIRDTDQDPRRPTKVVERYNTKQLNVYLGELNAFMSRGVGFVAGIDNTPIAKADWIAYKKIETIYNRIGTNHFNKIKHIMIGDEDKLSNLTVEERDMMMVPKNKRAAGEVVHRPYTHLDRDPSRIKDAESLAKIKAALEKKISADYLPSQISAGRSQAASLIKGIGANTGMQEKIDALNDAQFNVLWNYTAFATAVSVVSDSGGHRSKAIQEDENRGNKNAGVMEDAANDIVDYLEWAETLPKTNRAPRKVKKAAKRRRK